MDGGMDKDALGIPWFVQWLGLCTSTLGITGLNKLLLVTKSRKLCGTYIQWDIIQP